MSGIKTAVKPADDFSPKVSDDAIQTMANLLQQNAISAETVESYGPLVAVKVRALIPTAPT